MLKDVNDTPQHAHELVELVKDLEVKVNLIPFNPWAGCPFEPSSNNAIHRFQRIVEAAHIPTPIRQSRGQDIMAACGQLKSHLHPEQC